MGGGKTSKQFTYSGKDPLPQGCFDKLAQSGIHLKANSSVGRKYVLSGKRTDVIASDHHRCQ